MKAVARSRTSFQSSKTQGRLVLVGKHCTCITERLRFYARADNESSILPRTSDMQYEHHHQPILHLSEQILDKLGLHKYSQSK